MIRGLILLTGKITTAKVVGLVLKPKPNYFPNKSNLNLVESKLFQSNQFTSIKNTLKIVYDWSQYERPY